MEKVTINIPFEFTVKCESPKNVKPFFVDSLFKAWSKVILKAVEDRLTACKMSLFDNRDNVYYINDRMIAYITKESKRSKHYSIPAAEAMESVIKKINDNDFKFTSMELTQMSKALYWIGEEKTKLYDNYSFDDLVSVIISNIGKTC